MPVISLFPYYGPIHKQLYIILTWYVWPWLVWTLTLSAHEDVSGKHSSHIAYLCNAIGCAWANQRPWKMDLCCEYVYQLPILIAASSRRFENIPNPLSYNDSPQSERLSFFWSHMLPRSGRDNDSHLKNEIPQTDVILILHLRVN